MMRPLHAGFALVLACAATDALAEGLANPAAELCVKDGAKVEIVKAPNGSDSGVCVFPSGERIKEWAYFRNKHRTTH